MAVFVMIVRKMAKNRGLTVCLLLGMALGAALVCSMPIYKNAILEKMLADEFDRYYESAGQHPGLFGVVLELAGVKNTAAGAHILGEGGLIVRSALDSVGLPRDTYSESYLSPVFPAAAVEAPGNPFARKLAVGSRTGLARHIELTEGKLPDSEPDAGVYEALVTETTLRTLKTVLNKEWIVTTPAGAKLRIKPVGIMQPRDLNDPYWELYSIRQFDFALILDETLFRRELGGGAIPLASGGFFAGYGYRGIALANADELMRARETISAGFADRSVTLKMNVPAAQILPKYALLEQRLFRLLGSLYTPVLLLLGLYLYMVSAMIVEKQRAEMAVLRSRGATRLQIVLLYAAEAALLGSLAAAAGPFAGALVARMIGSANGFLDFVQREAVYPRIGGEAFVYGIAAALGIVALVVAPAVAASRSGVIDRQRQTAREGRMTLPHRAGADALLIATAIYGIHTMRGRIREFAALGGVPEGLGADPLLFVLPSVWILGFGLLLLRLYPLALTLAYRLGRRRWPPALYASLLQVGRHSGGYLLLLVFLIMTIGSGLFSAGAARTINENLSDQIRYRAGADIALQERWATDAFSPSSGLASPAGPTPAAAGSRFFEPPFDRFARLPGVASAARVFTKENAQFTSNGQTSAVRLMGIDTDDFGRTSWMKADLLPHDFYDYLNLIAGDARAVLVSRSIAEENGTKVGDAITIGWNGGGWTTVTVYGIIDYFPGFHPFPASAAAAAASGTPKLIVGHLNTLQNEIAVEPYEVWLKLNGPDDREMLFRALDDNGIALVALRDTFGELAEAGRDPFRMALNGIMSLGFVLSLALALSGFMLYWLFALQGRQQQLGIFRAMGLSRPQLLGMLAAEQALTTGAGLLLGFAAGATAGHATIPLFQLLFDPSRTVPPYQVVLLPADTFKLVLASGVMVAAALGILALLLKRMNIHQAVKLGEE